MDGSKVGKKDDPRGSSSTLKGLSSEKGCERKRKRRNDGQFIFFLSTYLFKSFVVLCVVTNNV